MKRIVTLVLVVVLVLSLSIAAFAEYTNGVPAIVVNGGSGPSLLLGIYNSSDKKITIFGRCSEHIHVSFMEKQRSPIARTKLCIMIFYNKWESDVRLRKQYGRRK